MNQFLSTFTSEVFSNVSDIIQIARRMHYQGSLLIICVAISMFASTQETRFFAECTGITIILLTHTFDSYLLVAIIKKTQSYRLT